MALGEEGRETLVDLVARTGTDDPCAARAIAALGDRLPAEPPRRRCGARSGEPGARRRRRRASRHWPAGPHRGRGADARGAEHDDRQVAAAAARALGKAGTVAAVPRCARLPKRAARCGSAARQAIAEIQARLAGAEPGQLTLAGGEAGALSLADAEPGRLSLADAPGEHLPPSDAEGEPEEATPKPKREAVGS